MAEGPVRHRSAWPPPLPTEHKPQDVINALRDHHLATGTGLLDKTQAGDAARRLLDDSAVRAWFQARREELVRGIERPDTAAPGRPIELSKLREMDYSRCEALRALAELRAHLEHLRGQGEKAEKHLREASNPQPGESLV